MRDLRKAAEWVRSNRAQIIGKVREPIFFTLSEAEQQESFKVLQEDEDEDARDSFMFRFTRREDMELFMSQCRDEQDLLVKP